MVASSSALRATAVALVATSAAAVPLSPANKGIVVEDVWGDGSTGFRPAPVPSAPDGMPLCEWYAGPHGPAENMADAFMGVGTCDRLLSTGGKSCEHTFCPECSMNEYCNKACGLCESTADEPVDCDTSKDPSCWNDPTCLDDEEARAAADPFNDPLSPFTQGCAEIADNGYCEDPNYVNLGVLDFCCEACRLAAEERKAEGVCDFMAVANACSDLDEVAKLHGSINDVCSSACTQAVIANFDACNGMKDLVDEDAGAVDVERVCVSDDGSDDHCSKVGHDGVLDGTAEQEQECADAGPTCTSIYSDRSMQTLYDDSDHGLAEHLEAIVTGCTAWKNGGHYDLDAITGGTR